MLSLNKAFVTFPSQIPRTFQHRSLVVIRCTSGNGNDINSSPSLGSPITSPETVEIWFRRGSRRRRKQQEDGVANSMPTKQALPPKDWESMTPTEKVMELYTGEKGLLFWLNKFAYASIFILIGEWILFRIVGPSLNLYQLDTPPLSPNSMFKES